jgi:hypothetical protein
MFISLGGTEEHLDGLFFSCLRVPPFPKGNTQGNTQVRFLRSNEKSEVSGNAREMSAHTRR